MMWSICNRQISSWNYLARNCEFDRFIIIIIIIIISSSSSSSGGSSHNFL